MDLTPPTGNNRAFYPYLTPDRHLQYFAPATDMSSPLSDSIRAPPWYMEDHALHRQRYFMQLMAARHRSLSPPSPPPSNHPATVSSNGSTIVGGHRLVNGGRHYHNTPALYDRSAVSTPGVINPRMLSIANSPCPAYMHGHDSMTDSSILSLESECNDTRDSRLRKEEEHPVLFSSVDATMPIVQPTPRQPRDLEYSGLPPGAAKAGTKCESATSLSSEEHLESPRTLKLEPATPSVLDVDQREEQDTKWVSPSLELEARANNRRGQRSSEDGASYFCKTCNRGFARRYNYTAHLSTHDQHRPRLWKCKRQHCGKAFRRATDLKRHEHSVHLKSKAWVCDLCHAGFPRRDSLQRHEAQGCTMRGALKRRSTRQQTPTAIGACDDPYTQHSKGTMKQERLPMPGTETSPSVKQPTSSYDMPIKTDGFDTPSLFFPLQRDFEFEDRQQPWSPPATSDGPYGVGQQDVACNGYIPASCYISALDVPL